MPGASNPTRRATTRRAKPSRDRTSSRRSCPTVPVACGRAATGSPDSTPTESRTDRRRTRRAYPLGRRRQGAKGAAHLALTGVRGRIAGRPVPSGRQRGSVTTPGRRRFSRPSPKIAHSGDAAARTPRVASWECIPPRHSRHERCEPSFPYSRIRSFGAGSIGDSDGAPRR